MSQSVSLEDLDALELQFPDAFVSGGGRPRIPQECVVTGYGPLTAEHVALMNAHVESGSPIGVTNGAVKALRHTHHRLAQLLAGGMDETVAAVVCNYSVSRVSILKADPAFRELLAHYAATKEDAFGDFVTMAADLSKDMLQQLQAMLDEAPEKFGPTHLMDAIKLLADRTGHAPMTKTLNVNVNVDMADKLRRASARREAARTLPPPDA